MAEEGHDETHPEETRRGFFERISSWGMFSGLAAGYGMFAFLMGRFLFPNIQRRSKGQWMFVLGLADIAQGESMTYVSPVGERVVISRVGMEEDKADFIALSSVCPHLGCQVHWESQNNRFFCPCHNGVFDPEGNPLEGPPKDADQLLTRYPLMVEKGLLYIQVSTEALV